MKSSLLKIITAASLSFAAFDFAQDNEELSQEEVQSNGTEEIVPQEDENASQTTTKTDVQTSGSANVQVNINLNVQNNNIQKNSSSSSKSYAESNAQTEAPEETSPAKTEPRVGIGAKVAFDYGIIYGLDDEDEDMDGSPSGMGFSAGLMLRVKMMENFYFVPELNFAYIKTEHDYLQSSRKYTRMDMEIPLMLRGIIANRFYGTFGAQLSLNLSNSVKAEVAGMDTEEDFDQDFLDFGIAAGMGVKIVENFYFDLRIYMGLTELFSDVDYLFDENSDKVIDPTKDTGWSMLDLAGGKNLKFKAGISYWFI